MASFRMSLPARRLGLALPFSLWAVVGCSLETAGTHALPTPWSPGQGGPSSADGGGGRAQRDGTAPVLGQASDAGDGNADAGASTDDGSLTDPRDAVLGTYAVKRSFRTIQRVRVALFTNDIRQLTTTYALATVRRDAGEYAMTETACRIEVETDQEGVQITIPDRVPQSVEPVTAPMEVRELQGVLAFTRPSVPAAVGWVPNGPADELPRDADDPRVIDADGDTHPGVSVHIRADIPPLVDIDGDAYVVQWYDSRLEGTRDASGRLSGTHEDNSEQWTIGASDSALDTNQEWVDDPVTADNRFLMVPVDPDTRCPQLISKLSRLFP